MKSSPIASIMRITLAMLGVAWVVSCKLVTSEIEAEQKRLRQLVAVGDFEGLADLLDRSMVTIPAGEFTLGSLSGHADEQPQRQIYLDTYQIDRYEVTNAQYRRFVQAEGIRPPQHWEGDEFPPGQADWPVTGVSWQEAHDYCQWAGKRLPSEAEWEKACRGLQGSVYPWGNDWQPDRANTGIEHASQWPPTVEAFWKLLDENMVDERHPHPQPVDSYLQGASAYGVMDMAGNASEWVLDWYNWQGYQHLPERNPIGEAPPWNHSVRGSGWVDKDGEQDLVADLSRCSKRNSSHTSNDPRLGFRCAKPLP